MAARAHDVAAIALRGRSACLNFADSTGRLTIPASSDNKDIRKAAAEAAEAFRRPLEFTRKAFQGENMPLKCHRICSMWMRKHISTCRDYLQIRPKERCYVRLNV
ncbi:hypothetical protein RND71_023657 [Anisodus tanguticus]|uniref:Uncharacterized protein n=1 Tax=Anisodus tanguticus TaxID=243964 RepID=A0AAE1RV89_9SOLA|nr:hypothetical protein RND71_023657 [Anisodus tanguticus]